VESAAAFAWNRWQACHGISGSFRAESVAAFARNRWQPSRGISGRIHLESVAAFAWNTQPDQHCVFLSEEKMCKIQLKYGEQYLSNTCAMYPRQINAVGSGVEKSAAMSCPEAARLALLNPEGIEFLEIEEPVEVRYCPNRTFHTENMSFTKKAQQYFWEIRIFVMQLLKYRDISLNDRLILLGRFCHKSQEYINKKTIDSMPSLFNYYITHRSLIFIGVL
jgi:hypothetical protein